MARYILTLGLIIGPNSVDLLAQEKSPIQLDRPDQTECPFITPKYYLQAEHGFTIEKINSAETSFLYPTTLWKYGVNEKFEIRLITELLTEKKEADSKTGITPITIGFKAALFEESGLIPKTSFIGHITSAKIGSKWFRTSCIAPSFRFTMQHTISKKVSLAYNLGSEWNGEKLEQTFIYTLTTGVALSNKLGCYVELYGFIAHAQKPDKRFDTGITYLLNNNLMIDISVGKGIKTSSFQNYGSFGLSYRFKTRN
jgi:Putative MetA-pathway of phenol degradation